MKKNRMYYRTIYCALTYKNTDDIITFLKSVAKKDKNYKVIIINSFYDDISNQKFEKIAYEHDCDFLQVENRGYGYGNNQGIMYARETYEFDFLVVCNPDTEIVHLANLENYVEKTMLVAPKIIRNDGRNQNPMRVTKPFFSEKVAYLGFKRKVPFFVLSSICLNKLDRILHNASKKNTIYECHGSFIIFTHKALDKLIPVFDEKIFLFCEESDLAKKCKEAMIPIVYDSNYIIRHYEDGSMKLSSWNLKKILAESFIYYYEKWNKK